MRRNEFVSPVYFLLATTCFTSLSSCTPWPGPQFQSTDAQQTTTLRNIPGLHIQPRDMMAHIQILASDGLEGRGTGERGIDIAAGYIAGRFAASGLMPVGDDHTYFQAFMINNTTDVAPGTTVSLQGSSETFELHEDFTALSMTAAGSFDSGGVFVGYGITDSDRQYDDYADVDVDGQVVLMLRREPTSWTSESGSYSRHATFRRKISNAIKHGASAILIVNQRSELLGSDDLMSFQRSRINGKIPILQIKRTLADTLLAAGSLDNINNLQARIDKDGAPISSTLDGVTIRGQIELVQDGIEARNVIGLLPATSDSDEYLVIGAHYDHLGKKHGQIYNGADDNASGTAAVIEMARVFSQQRERRRNLVFMAFSGEELGLLGSAHYVYQPIFPLDHTIAMINLDMIGRLDQSSEMNKLAVHGLGTGENFEGIVDRHAARLSIDYIKEPSALGPSDHASFYRGGVPALFFFTGIHDDYHQPGDDIEKIHTTGAAFIAEMAYRTADDLLNEKEAPHFVEVNQRARIFRGAIR